MKKSKFLKKSLAMLLALMLVVAMIPLSASAAAPVLGPGSVAVEEDGNGSFSTLNWGEDGFTGDISNATQSISLQALIQDDQSGAEVWYRNLDETSNQYKQATSKGDGLWEIDGLSVAKYTQGSNVVVELQVRLEGGSEADADTYTVTLTPKAGMTDTLISDLVIWDMTQDLPQLETPVINQTAGTIDVVMPHTSVTTTYRIDQLTWPTGATVTVDGNPIKLDVHENPLDASVVTNGSKITVTNSGYTTVYTVNLTTASGFDSFGFEEALDTIVFPEGNAIAVLLPYGYAETDSNKDANGNVIVTPVFDFDYESDSVTWSVTGAEINSGDSIYTDDAKVNTSIFYDYIGTRPATSWNLRKANNPTWAGFKPSRTIDPTDAGFSLTVNYTETSSKTYNVFFYETQNNNANEITEVTIGSETATIDGRNINITLPAGSDASQIGSTALPMTITASDEAQFSVPLQAGVEITDQHPDTRKVVDEFEVTSATYLDATQPVIIRVTADDGRAKYDYTLNVTVADSYEAAKITSIYLKAPGSDEPIEAEGDIQNGTILFKVPYTVVEKSDLEGYKLYYSKTVGSTITYGDSNADMPKSGVVLTGSDPYIPNVADGSKIAITVTSTAPGSQSSNTKTYYLQIDREDPVAGHTLEEFAFTGTLSGDTLTDDVTYDDTSIANGKIDVTIPWSAYQEWSINNPAAFGAQLKVNGNAKAYVVLGQSRLYPLTEDNGVLSSSDVPFSFASVITNNQDNSNTNDVRIAVLSERVWVDMEHDYASYYTTNGYYALTSHVQNNPENTNEYTIYNLTATRDAAKTTISPVSLTLVDGAGWTSNLNVDLNGQAITGSVPYGFISRGTDKPIYLDYDVADRAYVLADDKTKADYPEKDGAYVPTSLGGDGVFADYGEYTGTDSDFRTSHPYLVLTEDAANPGYAIVKVYKASNPVTNAADNKLFIVNENGDVNKADLTFRLQIDEANNGCEFTSFAFEGYESFRGVIDNDNDTITVTLPFGTEYTYLTPVYSTSKYASVTVVDTGTVDGDTTTGEMHSGESKLNFSTSRRIRVTAENGTDYTTYTVTVKVADQFNDVNPGDWFYDNVMGAVSNGFMTGKGQGIFDPTGTTTRAEFACALASAMGYEATEGETIETPFIDVNAGDWYAGAVNFCYDNGIVSGYDDTTFRPTKTITRQEAAAMLNNAFGLSASSDVSKFTDASSIAGWATAHVGAVANAELMNGDKNGTFRPTGTLIRAELASILMNALNHGYLN